MKKGYNKFRQILINKMGNNKCKMRYFEYVKYVNVDM